MLNENEIRCIIQSERNRLCCLVDPVERKVCMGFIAGLECALND